MLSVIRSVPTSFRLLQRYQLQQAIYTPTSPTTVSVPVPELPSNVEKGLSLELSAIQVLSHLNFQLRHVGGANDRGIDLRGTWSLPSSSSSTTLVSPTQKSLLINVIVQCKNEASPIGPQIVRELEGTLNKETGPTLGLLVTSNGLTRRALDAIHAAKLVIGFANISMDDQPTLTELQFNHVAQRTLLSSIVIAPRYVKNKGGQWTRQIVVQTI